MKKLLTIMLSIAMVLGLVACSSNNEETTPSEATTPEATETAIPESTETADYPFAAYPDQKEFYSIKLGYNDETCTLAIPAAYVFDGATIMENSEAKEVPAANDNPTIEDEITSDVIDLNAIYSVFSMESLDGSVSLKVEAYPFGTGSALESFDGLFEGNKSIEQLEGTAARLALQSEVEGYDFKIYVEVNADNYVVISYKGDSSVDAKEMALNVYQLIELA